MSPAAAVLLLAAISTTYAASADVIVNGTESSGFFEYNTQARSNASEYTTDSSTKITDASDTKTDPTEETPDEIVHKDDPNAKKSGDFLNKTAPDAKKSGDFGEDSFPPGGDIFPRVPILVSEATSAECARDSARLAAALRNTTHWAVSMWDASGKDTAGLISGSVYQLGNFDQCLAARAPFQPSYCLATLRAERRSLPRAAWDDPAGSAWNLITRHAPGVQRRDAVHRGLCVPASCSSDDVRASLGRHLVAVGARRTDDVTLSVELRDADCQTAQARSLDAAALAFCVLVAALAALLFCSSLYDLRRGDGKDAGVLGGFLLCFSLPRNLAALAVAEPDKRLHLIHGVRFLAMVIIIFTHTAVIFCVAANSNFTLVEWLYAEPLGKMLQQGEHMVDVFFVLGGMMLVVTFPLAPEQPSSNFFSMVFLRYVRLTPAYALVIFFNAALLQTTGDGPLWRKFIDPESASCAANWWTNLLYVNNYVNVDKLCMIQSWYLPCDFHFFAAGALLLLALRRSRALGFALYACALVASVVPLMVHIYVTRQSPVLSFEPAMLEDPRASARFLSVEIKSHFRASAYLVGMAAGYLLHRTKGHKGIDSKWLPMAGLLLAQAILAATTAVAVGYYDVDADSGYDAVAAAVFAGLRRLFWALATAIFVLSLVFSKQSWIKRALCWRPFVALSKLVYCTYLVHLSMQLAHSASARVPEHVTFLTVLRAFCGDLAWTLLLSLLLHLAAEAPLRLVFKRLLRSPTRSAQPDAQSGDDEQKAAALA